MKYIKSEIFRMFKTPTIKYFMGFSVVAVIIALFAWDRFISPGHDYFELMMVFASIAIMMISAFSIGLAYKTKDTKIQILSYGMTREKMYLYDLISMHIISIIMTIILCALAIVSGLVGEKLGLVSLDLSVIDYMKFVLKISLFNVNLNNAIFGLTYILNSVPIGIIGNLMIIPMITNILSLFTQDKEDQISKGLEMFSTIQPYNLTQNFAHWQLSEYTDEVIRYVVISAIYTLIVFIIGGLIAFRKREIY